MRVIIGRDPLRTNIQVPTEFASVSRTHAALSRTGDGLYVLEDLGSSHGTFVREGGGWRRVTRASVGPQTEIQLANFQTSVGALLGSMPTGAVGIVGQPGGGGPPGGAVQSPAAASADSDSMPIDMLLRTLGIGDLVRIVTTLHAPLRGIRQLLAEPNKALHQAMIAYIALMAMVPFLQKEVIMPLGQAVSYPIMAQGQAVENAVVVNVVAVVSSLIGFLLMFSLPRGLYAPSTPHLVVATNIYTSLYVMIYSATTDLLKFAQFHFTRDMTLSIVIGLAMMLFGIVFQIYVWRRILQLRWGPIVLFLVIGLFFGFMHGFVLAKLGLIKYAGA